MADNTDTETHGPHSQLAPGQYMQLLREIDPTRVRELKGNSYVEAWDVRRQLTRIFGFGGWDLETISLDLVREIEGISKKGGPCWTVVYRAQVRLTIKTPNGTTIARYEDASSGDAANQPGLGDAHDLAMKSALSGALKRCAVNLGDQFGLSLYNKGDYNASIRGTLVPPVFPETPAPAEELPAVDAVIGGELDETETVEPERYEPQLPAQRAAAEQPASAPTPATVTPKASAESLAAAEDILVRMFGVEGPITVDAMGAIGRLVTDDLKETCLSLAGDLGEMAEWLHLDRTCTLREAMNAAWIHMRTTSTSVYDSWAEPVTDPASIHP
jgi:hypothetical protein